MTRFTPVGLLTACLLLPLMGLAQPAKPLRYRLEVGRYAAASGQTPFWLRANQYGLVPRPAPLLTLRLAIGMDYRPTPVRPADSLRAAKPRIDWGWGLQAVFNGGKTNQLLLAQAFLKLKLRPGLEIWAGRREELIGLADSALTSGSYAWSGNTRPMLKIQLALPDYLPRHALFGVKGVYGHGWFEPDRLFTNLFLHQKALYGRLGKPHWRLKLFGGINHQVMWGGRTDRNLGPLVKQHQLPNRFSDYLHIITARALANQSNLDTTRISGFDRENRIGNHLGSVDVGIEYTAPRFSLFAYRQHPYDDGSLAHRTNLRDGLNGLRIRNRRGLNRHGFQLQSVLLEYLYTRHQGGDLFLANARQRGRDNYFNHSQYQDGWSGYGLTMGTPFITPSADSQPHLPTYGFTNNNRVAVMHLGLGGQAYDRVGWQLKASYSQNGGTYEVPFGQRVDQFSSMLSAWAPLGRARATTVTVAIGADVGDLYARSVGFYVGLRQERPRLSRPKG